MRRILHKLDCRIPGEDGFRKQFWRAHKYLPRFMLRGRTPRQYLRFFQEFLPYQRADKITLFVLIIRKKPDKYIYLFVNVTNAKNGKKKGRF